MAIRRASKSSISATDRGKGSNLIAGYSPAVDEMDLIERVTVGVGGTGSITFSNIPQTYQHLHIRGSIRTNRTPQNSEALAITFNSISTSTYTFHILYGEGSGSGGAGGYVSQSRTEIASMMASGGMVNNFGAFISTILDYSNTSKNTTIKSISGNDQNGSGVITLSSGLWINTAAITSITLDQPISTSFVEHTTVSLYGVKE